MSTMRPVRYCAACRHAEPVTSGIEGAKAVLFCAHPTVNATDPASLASPDRPGHSECVAERSGKRWDSQCGMLGALWEPKGLAQ